MNRVMELSLSREDLAALMDRTEGWIVGLQMAALSLQGLADRSAFIQAFSGSHRYILEYLLEVYSTASQKTSRRFCCRPPF
jgi:LuxR family maltose regulon positive regulatory protein